MTDILTKGFRGAVSALLYVLLLLATLFSLTGCEDSSIKANPAQQPAMPVIVRPLVVTDIPYPMEYIGQTSGFRDVQVRARVGGTLLKRTFREGQLVKAGDLLFEIDPEPSRAALKKAKGDLARAEAFLIQAQQDYARTKTLFDEEVVSLKEFDDATANIDAAKAERLAAKGQVETATLELGYTKVEAPVSGITGEEAQTVGNLISLSGESNLLTTITQLDPIYVNFTIPDLEVMKLRKLESEGHLDLPDQEHFQVVVSLGAGYAYPIKGKIVFMDSQVNPNTGTIRGKAIFDNPDAALLPGQFAKVQLHGGVLKNALIIPQRAVLNTQKGRMVYIVNAENRAEPRIIEITDIVGPNYLVGNGLKNGDVLIVDGITKISPNQLVAPHPETSAASVNTPPTAATPSQEPAAG